MVVKVSRLLVIEFFLVLMVGYTDVHKDAVLGRIFAIRLDDSDISWLSGKSNGGVFIVKEIEIVLVDVFLCEV